MPTARAAFAVTQANGKLYAIGGSGGIGGLSSVDVYDPSTNTWTTIASMPTPRAHLAAEALSGFVYAIGGC